MYQAVYSSGPGKKRKNVDTFYCSRSQAAGQTLPPPLQAASTTHKEVTPQKLQKDRP